MANGVVRFNPLPSPQGTYRSNIVVKLEVFPNESGSQILWSGVDSYTGTSATVRINEDRFVGVNIVPPMPTPTPTPTPSTIGVIIYISQHVFAPNESKTVTVTFQNTGTVRTHFRVSVASITSGWTSNDQCGDILGTTCEIQNVSPADQVSVTYTLRADSAGSGTATWRLLAAHTCGFFGCQWDTEVDRRSQSFSVFNPTPAPTLTPY